MDDVIVSVLANALWAFLGFILLYLYRVLFMIAPTKNLWKLKDPSNLIIVAATSTKTDTGKYYRPATGIGQLRALALVYASLNNAYKKIKVQNILLSEDQFLNNIENDIISLGGPKNNKITRLLLDKILPHGIINQIDNDIMWLHGNNTCTFSPYSINKSVKKDFGMVINIQNPFSSNSTTATIFSGSHTYGTIAAAKFYTENIYRKASTIKRIDKVYIAIISCDVIDGYPTNIQIEREYTANENLKNIPIDTIDNPAKSGDVQL